MAALPVFKLATLLVKMVAKPVASGIKARAKNHPRLSTISEKIGNSWYIFTQTAQLRLKGHKVKTIKPLSGKEALISGADFLGESFVYSVSASIVIIEVWRQENKAKVKEAQKKKRQNDKEAKRHAEFEQLESRIRTMTQEQFQLRKDFNALLEYKVGKSNSFPSSAAGERPTAAATASAAAAADAADATADVAVDNVAPTFTIFRRVTGWPWSWLSRSVTTVPGGTRQEPKA